MVEAIVAHWLYFLCDDVELVGYDVSATRWAPGEKVTFTWYWHALDDVAEGFRAFTHVCDGTGNRRLGADDEGIVRRMYPVGRYREGEYVRDVQEITLPENFDAAEAAVYLGVYRGDERLPIRNGADDGDSRVRVVSLPTGGARPASAANADLPRLRAIHTTGPIVLDGRLSEVDWQRATPTRAFVDTISGAVAPFAVTTYATWYDAAFYVAFNVADPRLLSPFQNLDDHLWEQDCVEIMLDPGGDGLNYFELQANPRGAVFDTRYDTRRQPQPFGHVDWNSGMRVGVTLRGSVDDELEDEGYTVELAIPWTSLRAGSPQASTPPAPGEVWRGNFYVMNKLPNGMQAAGWSAPRIPDFHFPPRFGEIVFEASR